ncbi:tyrosine-type recombinase/integrase [Modestobacter marinus]|uniref:tyrosine-type recombinase/integrase n=1 Tax=Modestobacter marinus TaxID=477641 RepID=UPI001C984A32|nr:tyrosine-type recombinase/integrase [Modestobacter marinus]
MAALHQHKATHLGERMLAGSEWHDEDLAFAQPDGRPIDKKTDHDDWTRLLRSAGVRHVRLHDGRHTAATLLLSENVHPRVVMELLGHSQMRTTMDIYSHVMPALAREAADRMSALLLPGVVGPTATTTATRDESGRPPDGGRPDQMGGAEGTRTPDPHTARAAGRGPWTFATMRSHRSGRSALADECPRTTVNTLLWPPSWHHPQAA